MEGGAPNLSLSTGAKGMVTGMTAWQTIGLVVAGYLGLLARSAWKQGEMRQFLRSLLIVAGLVALVAGAVAVAAALDS
ncbi:hypothetical protein [Azospirillum sp. SYSU D00513]|uniref:hypothetical protein n=1 Tax=Azospirillum sp. SYSU D00513 TaxID=2812561 RepID=UPI001A960FBA|nr:hypothetical protein [Azospirillum sp. SYSU D00513]